MILTGKFADYINEDKDRWVNRKPGAFEKLDTDFDDDGNIRNMFGEFYEESKLGKNVSPDVLLNNISHKILSYEEKDDGIYCTVKVLDTPKGKLLKEYIINNDAYFMPNGLGTDQTVKYVSKIDIIVDNINDELKVNVKEL